MNSILGLMATSGGNFVSIAHLEIPLLNKMLMCQILQTILPAVYLVDKKMPSCKCVIFKEEGNYIFQIVYSQETSHNLSSVT